MKLTEIRDVGKWSGSAVCGMDNESDCECSGG